MSRAGDVRAAAMFARYELGLSLSQVAAELGCTRQTVYGLFAARGWKLRSRTPARKCVGWNGLRYTMRDSGYFACTTGDRHLLHRAVWALANGPIPDDYDVHHRDEDKTNNALSNLECLPKAEHTRLYSPHCNGFKHTCGAHGAAA